MVTQSPMKLEFIPTVLKQQAYEEMLDEVAKLLYEYFCQLRSSNSSTLSKNDPETQKCLSEKVSHEKLQANSKS